jgi:hypothetical protein
LTVTPVSPLDSRAFSPGELRDGWRLACRVVTATDLRVHVPPLVTRPKAATVGVGRQVILRPAAQKRYLELDEPSLAIRPLTWSGCLPRWMTWSCGLTCTRCG